MIKYFGQYSVLVVKTKNVRPFKRKDYVIREIFIMMVDDMAVLTVNYSDANQTNVNYDDFHIVGSQLNIPIHTLESVNLTLFVKHTKRLFLMQGVNSHYASMKDLINEICLILRRLVEVGRFDI